MNIQLAHSRIFRQRKREECPTPLYLTELQSIWEKAYNTFTSSTIHVLISKINSLIYILEAHSLFAHVMIFVKYSSLHDLIQNGKHHFFRFTQNPQTSFFNFQYLQKKEKLRAHYFGRKRWQPKSHPVPLSSAHSTLDSYQWTLNFQ